MSARTRVTDPRLWEARRFVRKALERIEQEPINGYEVFNASEELRDATFLLDDWLNHEDPVIPVTIEDDR